MVDADTTCGDGIMPPCSQMSEPLLPPPQKPSGRSDSELLCHRYQLRLRSDRSVKDAAFIKVDRW